jgi:hypothetical protein
MPKPGRPPKDKAARRDARLSVRVSTMLHDMLSAEAAKNRQTLADEVSLRLWQSFTLERDVEERFGGVATARLLYILAERTRAIEIECGGQDRWLDNPFVFHQVRQMIDTILDHRRPPGRRVLPELMRRRHPSLLKDVENIGRHHALFALNLLDAAASEPPPEVLPPHEYYYATVPLGIHKRPSFPRRKKSTTKTKGQQK